jgi:hypothetical protein
MDKKEIIDLIKRLEEPDYTSHGCELCKSEAKLAQAALTQLLFSMNGLPVALESATELSKLYSEGYRKGYEDCRKRLQRKEPENGYYRVSKNNSGESGKRTI